MSRMKSRDFSSAFAVSHDLPSAESVCRRIVEKELARDLEFSARAHSLGLRVIDSIRSARYGSKAAETQLGVLSVCLGKLVNDVRICELSVLSGYPLQALTLLASTFEMSFRTLHVSRLPERAYQWLLHAEPEKSYPNGVSIRDLVRLVCKERIEDGLDLRTKQELDPDQEYELYRVLCGFKHSHPLFTSPNLLHSLKGMVGPDASVEALALCRVALCAAPLILMNVLRDVLIRVPNRGRESLKPKIRALVFDLTKQLNSGKNLLDRM